MFWFLNINRAVIKHMFFKNNEYMFGNFITMKIAV